MAGLVQSYRPADAFFVAHVQLIVQCRPVDLFSPMLELLKRNNNVLHSIKRQLLLPATQGSELPRMEVGNSQLSTLWILELTMHVVVMVGPKLLIAPWVCAQYMFYMACAPSAHQSFIHMYAMAYVAVPFEKRTSCHLSMWYCNIPTRTSKATFKRFDHFIWRDTLSDLRF